MRFGDKLKLLRKEKGLSQEQLGKILKISRRVIGYYETNERFPKDEETLRNIADFFNVSTDYLIGRAEYRNGAIIENDDIPKELRKLGVEYLEVTKELKEKGFTPKKIKDLIESLEKAGIIDTNKE